MCYAEKNLRSRTGGIPYYLDAVDQGAANVG
jgi:hypothetical protein